MDKIESDAAKPGENEKESNLLSELLWQAGNNSTDSAGTSQPPGVDHLQALPNLQIVDREIPDGTEITFGAAMLWAARRRSDPQEVSQLLKGHPQESPAGELVDHRLDENSDRINRERLQQLRNEELSRQQDLVKQPPIDIDRQMKSLDQELKRISRERVSG